MNKPKFVRYNDIENWWTLSKIMEKYNPDFNVRMAMNWIVTEKIHGSNVCVSNRYKEGPAFFTREGHQLPSDYQTVMKSYDWEGFFKRNVGIDFVYGEIAGYKIQKGVNYGDRKFYIFDLKGKDGDYHLPLCLNLVDEFGFYYAPVYKTITATYEDLVQILRKNLKEDPVSQINPVDGNFIEGYVVKCLNMPMLTNMSRFIFKIKHPRFEEKVRAASRKNKKKDDTDYSPVAPYLNENRIQSATSKYPGYKKSQIGDVMRAIVNDIQKDMKKDGLRWSKKYCKYINRYASKYVVRNASL